MMRETWVGIILAYLFTKDYKKLKLKRKFDVITLWHVLEHIKDFKELLDQLKELLNENGLIILGLPNHKSLDANIFKESWVAYDVPIHLSHFTQHNIKELVRDLSFKSLSTKPLFFDAYYISLLAQRKRQIFLFWIKVRTSIQRKQKRNLSTLVWLT